jgi:hypothetical protein
MTAALIAGQNADGGWGASAGGRSWTEPTAWALVALQGRAPEAVGRGVSWLRKAQLADGSWPASPGAGGGTWVGAVAALLPAEVLGAEAHARALERVAAGASGVPGRVERVRQWMLGVKPAEGPPTQAWPWVPGTAPWLTPTVFSLLALGKDAGARGRYATLLENGRNYLFERQCADGGWNHGSSRVLGYDGASYPETTGLALLALRGVKGAAMQKGLAAAERHARKCQTVEGAYWLRLALWSHGREAVFEPPRKESDYREMALGVIVERCMAGEGLL